MGFRIKIFKKQFICLLFSICSFITLVVNTNLRFILLIQCLITSTTSVKISGNFIQFTLSSSATSEFFFPKIYVSSFNILGRY